MDAWMAGCMDGCMDGALGIVVRWDGMGWDGMGWDGGVRIGCKGDFGGGGACAGGGEQ